MFSRLLNLWRKTSSFPVDLLAASCSASPLESSVSVMSHHAPHVALWTSLTQCVCVSDEMELNVSLFCGELNTINYIMYASLWKQTDGKLLFPANAWTGFCNFVLGEVTVAFSWPLFVTGFFMGTVYVYIVNKNDSWFNLFNFSSFLWWNIW